MNVAKATLEGLFADELALLQPTPGYMRVLKESVRQIWKARSSLEVTLRERTTGARLEVPLEAAGAFLVRELDNHVAVPRTVRSRVLAMPGVVLLKSLGNVGRETHVEARNSLFVSPPRKRTACP